MHWKLLFVLLLVTPAVVSSQTVPDSLRQELLKYEIQKQVEEQIEEAREEWRRELKVELRKVDLAKQYWYDSAGVILMLITVVLGGLAFLGYSTIRSYKQRIQEMIDDAIYKVDPRDMPIKIPESGMEKQVTKLNQAGFKKLSSYKWLDTSCTKNTVIWLADSDEKAKELQNFITDEELNEKKDVVFVVYTKGAHISRDILRAFDIVTYANNHLTLIQALFVAARGLVTS